jgi:hypothetical protein
MSAPIPGDPVYLGSFLANTHWYGVVGDGDTPAMQVATMEAVGQDAVICLDALKGEPGEKGDPADIVQMQYDLLVTKPSDLPTDLNNSTDVGKAWWIESQVYVWTGDHYEAKAMGSPGQPGETPHITVSTEVIPPDGESIVEQSGTSLNPHLNFKIAAPRGPAGPAAAIQLAEDYDNTLPPTDGQTIVWNDDKEMWEPSDFAAKQPQLYSVPEAAFNDYTGLTQRHTICSFTIPPLDYDWVPYVHGHIKAFGVELGDSDPMTIGCEVRVGDPVAGILVARSHGTIAHWTTVTPHFSSVDDPTAAVAPDNGVATIRAGAEATFNVNLVNDGLIGSYSFNKRGAQLTIVTFPQG